MPAGLGAGFFSYLNRNKASLAIDLKSERGAGVLRRLVAGADVLIENVGPGVMARLGFADEACATVNPGLIYCSFFELPTDRLSSLPGNQNELYGS